MVNYVVLTIGLILKYILYVPNISHNLESMFSLALDNNCRIIFDSHGYVIQDLGTMKVIHKGTCHKGLYHLNPSSDSNKNNVALLNTVSKSEMWHKRLGHPNKNMMRYLVSRNKISYDEQNKNFDCHACYCGKSHKLPFQISETRATRSFDLIHADVWGPSPIPSFGGFRYYLLLIDDYTRCSWLIPLHFKSDVFKRTNEFRTFVTTRPRF